MNVEAKETIIFSDDFCVQGKKEFFLAKISGTCGIWCVLRMEQDIPLVFVNYFHQRTNEMVEEEVMKLEQAVEVHGYRGSSKCKHNGVVNLYEAMFNCGNH